MPNEFNSAPYQEALSADIEALGPTDALPLPIDSFIARSLLQKAIRRGETRLALRAGVTLLEIDAKVLWRRLLVTALEDLGIHEWELLGKIIVAEAGKVARRELGTDLEIATALITRASEGTRCQAANDLDNIAFNSGHYDGFRKRLTSLMFRDALELAGNTEAGPVERAIGVHHCFEGLRTSAEALNEQSLLDAATRGLSGHLGGLYQQAYRRSRLSLATSSALLIHANGGVGGGDSATDDALPTVAWIGETPGYTFDQYTRSGLRAVSNFTRRSERWREFAQKAGLSSGVSAKAAGEFFFRVESAACAQRRSWDFARVLADQSARVGCFVPVPLAGEGLSLAFAEVAALNDERRALIYAE